ncbi:hypothetical protein K402DRAFT_401988 [Aulographum hederae CBS 113979]|uniref:DUF1996 domain-containing protein n=1 Tax=Aulographum hederae CBS 113979 TaxID=1176131 RepID=A0A6G1H7X2_9PEZI|nr:hypothetical protein K402DRAFT_401988 [Aulographum hederae CBS 113979]
MHASAVLSFCAYAAVANAYANVQVSQFMIKNIDPILSPGKYDSHMHSFFGSDAVTKNTETSAELQTGCTSAKNPNDLSIYWIPTLFHVAGTARHPITPALFSVYYENNELAEIPIPNNYRAVIGNPNAKSQADVPAGSGAKWFCEGDIKVEYSQSTAFPPRTCKGYMQTLLYFHDCVNPTTLKSAYSSPTFGTRNRCPADMKRMPRLRFSVRYDLRRTIPGGWTGVPPLELACGSSFCAHGDFMMGWTEDAAMNMLKATGQRTLKNVAGSKPPTACKPADRDPMGGTSDVTKLPAGMDNHAGGVVGPQEVGAPAAGVAGAPEAGVTGVPGAGMAGAPGAGVVGAPGAM